MSSIPVVDVDVLAETSVRTIMRRWREDAGLSYAWLARRTGKSRGNLCNNLTAREDGPPSRPVFEALLPLMFLDTLEERILFAKRECEAARTERQRQLHQVRLARLVAQLHLQRANRCLEQALLGPFVFELYRCDGTLPTRERVRARLRFEAPDEQIDRAIRCVAQALDEHRQDPDTSLQELVNLAILGRGDNQPFMYGHYELVADFRARYLSAMQRGDAEANQLSRFGSVFLPVRRADVPELRRRLGELIHDLNFEFEALAPETERDDVYLLDLCFFPWTR